MSQDQKPGPASCSNGVMRKATRRLGQLFDRVLEPSGLKATQHGMLAHIHHLGSPTLKELADELVMDLSALGHTLKPLERDGYVSLRSCHRDRRCRRVSLTPSGDRKLHEATHLWRIAQTRFESAFGETQAERLRESLTLLASPRFNDAFMAAAERDRPGHFQAGVGS